MTNATKSVAALVGAWNDGNTTLYYDDCGIFEGVLTEADFVPYRRNTLPVPAEVQALDGYGWGINADCYTFRAVIWLDTDLSAKRFLEIFNRCVEEAINGFLDLND